MKEKGQLGCQDEAAQELGGAPGPAGDAAEVVEQLIDAERTAVSELGLEVVPDLLIGVEFGRVGGKALDHEARMAGQDLADRGPDVNRAAVPQQDDGSAQLAQQLIQVTASNL
jgi:hypothetical protein